MTGKVRPKWFPKNVTDSDLQRISEAVRLAEQKTTGEIVPMIVRGSASFGHVPVVLTLALFSALLFLDLELIGEMDRLSRYVSFGLPFALPFSLPQWILAPVLLILCFLISLPLSKISWVRRALTSNVDEANAVAQRAEIEFCRGRYGETEKNTAILIFVSLTERRAVVLADHAIANKIDNGIWAEIVGLLLSGLKKGDFVGGWSSAIERSGGVLSEHFPASHHDKNEISNHLVIKE